MLKVMFFNIICWVCLFFDRFVNKKNNIPIIFYHSISDKESRLSVDIEVFEKQIEYLKKSDFSTMSANKINEQINQKLIIITFDDGFKDNFSNALPVLKKHGFTATIFIATKYIGKNSCYCAKAEDRNFEMLNKEEILDLEKEGWDIGSHFHSHENLVELDEEGIKAEYKKSKEILENIVLNKQSLEIVSFPRNKTNQKVLSICKKFGIRIGFVGGNRFYDKKSDNILSVPRIEIDRDISLVKFKLNLSPSFQFIKRHLWK